MGDGEEIIIRLVIGLVFGGITSAIAASKGRNAVGWFFLGFFFACISLIIILCLSNVKEEEARWSANEIEQRRLREQLRQEQLKNEALRQHTAARLDLHDKELGIDTRQASPGISVGSIPPRKLLVGDAPAAPPQGLSAENWYVNETEGQGGPYTFALLQARARQGTLSADTLVWVEGMEDWQPSGTISNLFPS
jgi:hypothetical protein